MAARRVLQIVLLGIAALAVILALTVYVVLETRWGMDRVRRFGLGFLNDRIPGSVRIARISGPGLLGGLRLYEIEVYDPDDRLVISADSARVSYDWRSFIRRRPVLDDVFLYALDVRVVKEPGEEQFGIQRAFVSDEPADTAAVQGEGMPLEAHGVSVVGGRLLVRQPVEDEPVETSRFVLESVPGGTVRIFEFEHLAARLGSVLVGGPDSRVTANISAASVQGRVLRDPFVLERASGRVTLRDSMLVLDMPVLELADSRVGVRGDIVLGTDWIGLNVKVDAKDVALADFRWVDARVPGRGTFAGNLDFLTVGGALQLDGTDLRVAVDGSRINASGGVLLSDRMELRSLEATLDPLEMQLVQSYVERELPIEGLIQGRLAADGPLERLQTSGDLRLRPRGAASPARARWSGTVGATNDPVLRAVELQVDGLEAGVLAAFSEALDLGGSIDARLHASGPLARGVTINGTVTHRLPGDQTSTIVADGSFGYASGATTLDMELRLDPLRLEALARMSPQLAAIRGAATGSVRLTGPITNLGISGDLTSPAGNMRVGMRISGEGVRRFNGEAILARLHPARVLPDLPDVGVSGQIRFDIAGTELATMRGSIAAALDSASFQRIALGPLRLDSRFEDGLLHLDTLIAEGPGSSLNAEGTLGLEGAHSGTIAARLFITSLQPLEPYLFDDESPDPTVARIDGSGEVNVRLAGSLQSLSVDGEAALETVRWQEEQVFALRVRAQGSGIASDSARLDVYASADSAAVAGHSVDSTYVNARLAQGAITIAAYAGIQGRDRLRAEVVVRRDSARIETRLASLILGDSASAWALTGPAIVRMEGPTITVDSVTLQRGAGTGRFAAQGRITRLTPEGEEPTPAPLDFTATLSNVPLGEMVALAGFTSEVQGKLGGSFRLTGTPQAPIMEGAIAVDSFALDNAALDSLDARVEYADQRLEVATQGFGGGRRVFFGEGHVPVDLRLGTTGERRLAENMNFTFRADSMPARFLLGFVDAITDVDGVLDGEMSARGSARDPQLSGAFALRRGAATIRELGVRYRSVVGTFLFEQDMLVKLDLSARATPANDPANTQGSVRVTGELNLAAPTNPGFDLDVQMQGLLAARRRDVDINTSGNVRIEGRYDRPTVKGDIRASGILNVDELFRRTQVVALEDPLLLDVVDTTLVSVKRVLPQSENLFLKNLRIQDFNVTVLQGTRLRSREMNVEVTGELNVLFDRQAEDLRLTGTLNTVRGTYRLDAGPLAKIFDVQEGTVTFPGTPGVNPNLSLQAVHRVRTPRAESIEITAHIAGTLESPRVTLRSATDPNISQSDLVSYLFIGMPSYAIGSGSGSSSSFGEEQFASLGLTYITSGLQSLVQGTGLLDYVGLSAAETAGGDGSAIQNTQIELGRYLSPSMFVVITQRLGTESGTTPNIRLEWRLTRTYRADLYIEDRFARAPSFGLSQIANARKAYGFLLYREWGY